MGSLKIVNDKYIAGIKVSSLVHSLRLMSMFVKRELKVKYRGSVLGYLWSMLNPLLFMVIISFVFSKLIRGIEHYDVYVLAGILFWNMTAQAIVGGTNSFVFNAGLMRKVRMPIWIFAIVPLGSALTNLALAIFPYVIIMLCKGIPIPNYLFFLPLLLFFYSIFLAGICLILATLNVFFRDVAHVIEPLLQLAFYATPIIYDRNNPAIPAHIKELLGYNPLTQFVEIFRAFVFKIEYLDMKIILFLLLGSFLSLSLGVWVYTRNKYKLIYKL